MAVVTHTYTSGAYTARVFDDNMVELEKNGVVFDRPGPWGDHEGARQWAELIVGAKNLEEQEQTQPTE